VPGLPDEPGQQAQDAVRVAEQQPTGLAVGCPGGVPQRPGDLGAGLVGRGRRDPGEVVVEPGGRPDRRRGQEVGGVAAPGLQQGDRPQVERVDLRPDGIQPAFMVSRALVAGGESDRREGLEGRGDREAAAP
jgi:hypothetical protein